MDPLSRVALICLAIAILTIIVKKINQVADQAILAFAKDGVSMLQWDNKEYESGKNRFLIPCDVHIPEGSLHSFLKLASKDASKYLNIGRNSVEPLIDNPLAPTSPFVEQNYPSCYHIVGVRVTPDVIPNFSKVA